MEIVGDYQYSKSQLLGHGAFAIVYKGHVTAEPEKDVAIKVIAKKNLEKQKALMIKEIGILKALNHENIVTLLDCKENRRELFLIIDFCNAGDLSDFMRKNKRLNESTVQAITYQLAQAMAVLFQHGVMHRDLKPQNILMHKREPTKKDKHSDSSGSNCTPPPPGSNKKQQPLKPEPITARDLLHDRVILKLADFGFARVLRTNSMAATLCGSPMYMAPEVITSQKYTAKADLWSIGVIIYQALTMRAPFPQPNPPALRDFYNNHTHIKAQIPEGISTHLKDLLNQLLEKDPERRICFDKFFKHPFIKDFEDERAKQKRQAEQISCYDPRPRRSGDASPGAASGGGCLPRAATSPPGLPMSKCVTARASSSRAREQAYQQPSTIHHDAYRPQHRFGERHEGPPGFTRETVVAAGAGSLPVRQPAVGQQDITATRFGVLPYADGRAGNHFQPQSLPQNPTFKYTAPTTSQDIFQHPATSTQPMPIHVGWNRQPQVFHGSHSPVGSPGKELLCRGESLGRVAPQVAARRIDFHQRSPDRHNSGNSNRTQDDLLDEYVMVPSPPHDGAVIGHHRPHTFSGGDRRQFRQHHHPQQIRVRQTQQSLKSPTEELKKEHRKASPRGASPISTGTPRQISPSPPAFQLSTQQPITSQHHRLSYTGSHPNLPPVDPNLGFRPINPGAITSGSPAFSYQTPPSHPDPPVTRDGVFFPPHMSPIAGGAGPGTLHSPSAGGFYPPGQHSPNAAIRPMTPGRREHSPLTVIHEEERAEERLLKDLKFDLTLGLVLSGLTKMHSRQGCGNGLVMALSYSSEGRSSGGSSTTSGDTSGSSGDLGHPMTNTMRNSFMERYVDEIIGHRTDATLLYEKVSLYYRCMQHVATALHKARNLISCGEIKKSERFRQVCMDLATLYTKIGDSLNEAKQESLKVQGLLGHHDDFRSSCSLALEDDEEPISESDSSEDEQIRSADKLIFIYALSLSMHAAGVEITVGSNGSPVNVSKRRPEDEEGKAVEAVGINKSHSQNLLNCYNKAYTLFKSLGNDTPESDVHRKQQLSDYLKAIQIRINALSGRTSPAGARRYRRTSTRAPRSRQGSTSSIDYVQSK